MSETASAHELNGDASSPSSVVVEARDLTRRFENDGTVIHALAGVSLAIQRGSLIVFMGSSGSGKSTLLHLLAGIDQPSSGAISISGHSLQDLTDRDRTIFRRRHLGIVFQAYNLLPTLSALENTMLPGMLEGRGGKDEEKRGRELLEIVGLGHRVDHRPSRMSGGEQQRVAIARALMNDPVVILADEPTGNLDTKHSESIWRVLRDLVDHHDKTVVAVTHEPSGATFADQVLVMKDGQFVGTITPAGEDDAATVAARYTELVG